MDSGNRELIVCLSRLTQETIEDWTLPRLKNNKDNQKIGNFKTYCEKTYLLAERMDVHVKTVHIKKWSKRYLRYQKREKLFKCCMCDKSYSNSTKFEVHIRSHTGEKPFKCDLCPMRFSCTSTLKRHQNTHSADTPYACDICEKSFKQSSLRALHIKNIHGNPIRRFKCTICEKSFARQYSLKIHIRFHTGEKPYKCSMCEKYFAQLGKRNEHIIRVHTKEKSYACSLCTKPFVTSSGLTQHMKSHTNDKILKCSFCEKSFKTQANRRADIQRIHTKEKPHGFPNCPKSFVTVHELRSHLKIYSSAQLDKIYNCKFCEKMLFSKNSLFHHLKRHTGERPHKCSLCSRTFIFNWELNNHIKKTHLKEKNHFCSMCDKSFFSSAELILHIRSHTKEKPFKCQSCSKMFSCSSNLSRHLTTHSDKIHTVLKLSVCEEKLKHHEKTYNTA